MRKARNLFIIILLILIIPIGCKDTMPIDPGDINKEPDIVEDGEVLEEDQTMNMFLRMINPWNTAGELGIFIRENIERVTEADAEEMIQWLTLYQTEIIEDYIEKIYTLPYMEALNEDMDGILDKDMIENISDADIRNDYQSIIDGFMTIIRYEENPVVETDWKELNKLSPYVSEDFGTILELYQRIQNYDYNREELDVRAIGEDMIKIESILKGHKSGFIYTKGNEIYNLQTYALLIGPEGNYLGFFIHKNSKEYKDIIELKEDYPDSLLGQMITKLEEGYYENPMEVYDAIDESLQFGIESNKYLKYEVFEEGNGNYNILEIKIPDDIEKQDRINKMIKNDIGEYVKRLDGDVEFNLSMFSNYQDKEYISYNIFLEDMNTDGYTDSLIAYRTYNYIDEKFISLEDYLGTSFSELKSYLQSIKGIEINSTPEFQISDNGIDLFIEDAVARDGYIHLNKKDLMPYLSLEELITKY